MKETFPGYRRKTDDEIKDIWKDGIIVFDTNVLLNLYRYSKSTRETIISLIGKLKHKIWLPHQAALEYNKNRYEVIADQEKTYKEFTDKIIQIQKDLQSTNKPPFLSEKVNEELNGIFEKVNLEVKESIKKFCEYLKHDPIYSELTNIFEGRITEKYDDNRLEEIYREGEERYKDKVPPGYEDEKNKAGNTKYGDLVLWKQVLELAIKHSKSIILVTDERKSDWWWKIKDGRNMGPRHELIEEVNAVSGVDFHMYSSERFLTYGQSYLEEQINERAIKEIKAMKEAELELIRAKKIARIKEYESSLEKKRRLKSIYISRDDLNDRLNYINSELELSKLRFSKSKDGEEYYNRLLGERRFIMRELKDLNESIHKNEVESNEFKKFLRKRDDEDRI